MRKLKIYIPACMIISIMLSCNSSQMGTSSSQAVKNTETQYTQPVTHEEFSKYEKYDHSNFDENSIVIDNEWMPMTPGKELVYKGYDVNEDGEKVQHSVRYTITDLTKVIDGINTVVLFERDYGEEALEEAELAFFAQDKAGNVWHLGQYREYFDEVEFVGGRMWVVGHLEDAKAGIMMQADPKMGAPSYSQGYAPPPFNWTDRARVYKTNQQITNPSGTYNDVLVTEEYNQEEPGAFQLKYYARGIGNIGIGWKGNDPNQESMDLVEVKTLDKKEMERIRKEALVLEKRAYVYATTKPAVQSTNVNKP